MNKAKLTYLGNPIQGNPNNKNERNITVKAFTRQCKSQISIKDTTEILTSRFEHQVVNPSNKIRTAKYKQIIKIIKNLNPQRTASPGKRLNKYCKY